MRREEKSAVVVEKFGGNSDENEREGGDEGKEGGVWGE